MTWRFPLAVTAGSVLIGLADLANAFLARDVRVVLIATAFAACLTGFVARRRGALAGLAAVVAVGVAQAAVVLGTAWAAGDLARTYPDCDPCGLPGYTGRLLIVLLRTLGTVGVIAAVAGWLGEQAARRMMHEPSPP